MMNMGYLDPELEGLADELERDGSYRVLRAVPSPFCNMPEGGAPPDGRCVGIVDLETSGLYPAEHAIIELALMLLWLNDDSEVIAHFGPVSWLEDPGVPLDPRISILTGLATQHLLGKKIKDPAASALLDRADLLVAHNAGFEIGWLEKRYAGLRGKPWGCSCHDIDWLMAGCDGRAQQALLAQHGWFTDAHRASADVWSLFWLLQQTRRDIGGRPIRSHLQRLIEGADRQTIMAQAERAPFDKKDALRARGYRWNAGARFWQKELRLGEVAHEQAWFFRNGLPAFTQRTMTAAERHR